MARARSYHLWRKAVLARDGHRCVQCGATDSLHADHIQPVRLAPHLLLEVDNGRTLCRECHHKTDTFGGKALKGTRRETDPYGSR